MSLVTARQTIGEKWPRHLGDLLDNKRKEMGWSHEKLAEHFGVAQSTMSRWIGGQARPSGKRMNQIARFLGMDVGTAMKINWKMTDAQAETASLASKVTDLSLAVGELRKEVAELRSAQTVTNGAVETLLRRVKTARSIG